MSQVFISHAHSTASQAQAVTEALRALGYSVWIDEQLPAHRAFGQVLEEQLRLAKAVVVIWSGDATQSEWVLSEANAAREARKLVQLSIDGAKLPMPFDQIQCADMKSWTGDAEASGWKKVIASIADLTGGPSVSMVHTAPPSVRKNSICVLPFANMSDDPQQEYFSDGISEDIITDLSKVSALFVIARNTAFTFKGRSVDVSQVARQLNVSHVLEGSVRKAGGRVRITAQLNDGATGGHLWAERYDRDLTDIFALQDEIAEAIVTALKLKMLPEEKRQIERRGTTHLDAYDLYVRGTRPAFAPEEVPAQIALLEAATRLAPDYADAWGELAYTRARWRYLRPYVERDEITAVATAESKRALALEPQNGAAIAAQLDLLPPFGRFSDAEALAILLEKNVSKVRQYALVILHLQSVGRIREAIELAQRAYELDPLDPDVADWRGFTLYVGGRHAEARQIFEDALARWPDNQLAAMNLITVCVHTQDWARVDGLLAPERLAQFPLREYERRTLGVASVMRDPSPRSRHRPIEAARRHFEASGYADSSQLQLAAHLGALDEAHTIAAQARFGPAGDERDQMGWYAYRTHLLFQSIYPEFRRDPRFVQLCARLGLVDYWLTTQHWPDCVDEVAPYYDFKAECAKVAAGPPLPPANPLWT
jgi:adenylate cyclase